MPRTQVISPAGLITRASHKTFSPFGSAFRGCHVWYTSCEKIGDAERVIAKTIARLNRKKRFIKNPPVKWMALLNKSITLL
jgi:hypothetical protein